MCYITILCLQGIPILSPYFENGHESIVFGPSISRFCRSITLNVDVEGFRVHMIPISPRVSTEDIAQVSIVDTDSKPQALCQIGHPI